MEGGGKGDGRGMDWALSYGTLQPIGFTQSIAIHSIPFSSEMWEWSDCQAIMDKMKRLPMYKSVFSFCYQEPKV